MVNSLEVIRAGPVGVIRTQKFQLFLERKTHFVVECYKTTYRRHNVNLAGLFRISPIAGLKNCYARLQEGKIIAMGNQKAKIDQFKRSFP
jgi:hypothetical protein